MLTKAYCDTVMMSVIVNDNDSQLFRADGGSAVVYTASDGCDRWRKRNKETFRC